MHSILFVVHAGRGVGLGHLTRSAVAARSAIRRVGVQVTFIAVGDEIDEITENFADLAIRTMNGSVDGIINELAVSGQYSAICLDLFPQLATQKLAGILELLRRDGCQIIAIDSLEGCEDLIDLLYVPSCLSPTYPSCKHFGRRVVFGWDAYLLNIGAMNSVTARDPDSVLVLTGGGDTTGLGQDWPEILASCLPKNACVNWVRGPFSEPPIFPQIKKMNFIEHVTPSNLNALMRDTGIAITVFGVSFFELIAYGIPTVVFSPYGDRDARELNEIDRQGIAVVANDANDAGKKAAELIIDLELQSRLSARARDRIRSFDGRLFAKELGQLLEVS